MIGSSIGSMYVTKIADSTVKQMLTSVRTIPIFIVRDIRYFEWNVPTEYLLFVGMICVIVGLLLYEEILPVPSWLERPKNQDWHEIDEYVKSPPNEHPGDSYIVL